MKYTYTHMRCGLCVTDLLEENGGLSIVHYTSVSTQELEQTEVIDDDCVHYILFNVETLSAILETGLTYSTARTAVMYNFSEQYQWPTLEAELDRTVVWSLSCKKTAKGEKTTRSWQTFSCETRL